MSAGAARPASVDTEPRTAGSERGGRRPWTPVLYQSVRNAISLCFRRRRGISATLTTASPGQVQNIEAAIEETDNTKRSAIKNIGIDDGERRSIRSVCLVPFVCCLSCLKDVNDVVVAFPFAFGVASGANGMR